MKKILTSGLLAMTLTMATIQAQNIQISMSPHPSPYLSDWQTHTETLVLIVNNTSGKPIEVKVKTLLYNGNDAVIAETDLQKMPVLSIPAGVSSYHAEDIYPINALKYDNSYKDKLVKTGRLPDDNYRLCVSLTDPKTGLSLTIQQPQCKSFQITAYQPPILISPRDKDTVTIEQTQGFLFKWTPIVPLPSQAVNYRLQIWEILPGQDAMRAFLGNKPIVEKDIKSMTQVPWPADFELPRPGISYVWSIQAFDEQGRALVDNGGRAEPFSFVLKPELEILLNKFRKNICGYLKADFVMNSKNGKGIGGQNGNIPIACCYDITISNSYQGLSANNPFAFQISSPNPIASSTILSSGWNQIPVSVPPPTNTIIWNKLSGSIPKGSIALAEICFGDVKTDPFYITYSWLNKSGKVICKDSFLVGCDTSDLDLSGCDLDIDTTIVTVSCGNLVNISPVFDGTASTIKYTIYDSIGNVILSATNIPSYTFTLPGYGVYYGVVEASCGGGDDNGGDEDEDAFEIINAAPVADFSIKSTSVCMSGTALRDITTTDNSQEEGSLTYAWKITDIAAGTFVTYNVAEPMYNLDATKQYDVQLIVTDTKGCSSQKNMMVQSISTCKAKFDWWYSWCETCQDTSHSNVSVNFTNSCDFANCSAPPKYFWDFGNGDTSSSPNPIYTYKHVPCAGQSFTVKLTLTLGNVGDSDYCQTSWDTVITINNAKPMVGITKKCCDGLVFFYTDAVKGKWSTPGSMGIPKWPAVSKKIWKPLGIQVGQNYRQYYSTPGTYYVTVNGAESEDHNRCPVLRVEFKLDTVLCFNRNIKKKGTATVEGVHVKYKFTALALPLIHRMRSKIKTTGFKKAAEISTDFAGQINKQGSDGCYCAPQNVSASSGTKYHKRKAKAATSTSGKFRIGTDKATANFYIKVKNGPPGTYVLKLGAPPCDHPWFLFF